MMSSGNRYHEGPFSAEYERRGAAVRDDWRPSPETLNALEQQGINRYQANQQWRLAFIRSMRQLDRRNADWDSEFIQFVRQQQGASSRSQTAVPAAWRNDNRVVAGGDVMSDDWQPSPAMRDMILQTLCPEPDYLDSQRISFTSHFHGQLHSNWDQKFKQWINNGWNVYGHKHQFRQQRDEQKSFVETHTDRSWADDL